MSVKQEDPVITVLVNGKQILNGPIQDQRVLDLVKGPQLARGVWVPLGIVLAGMIMLGVVAVAAGAQSIWPVLVLGVIGLAVVTSQDRIRSGTRRKLRRLRGLR